MMIIMQHHRGLARSVSYQSITGQQSCITPPVHAMSGSTQRSTQGEHHGPFTTSEDVAIIRMASAELKSSSAYITYTTDSSAVYHHCFAG
eukprot:scaffold3490_cov35-Prasinocladus_malaysianus.AAC.3